jgi:hypothetical protein
VSNLLLCAMLACIPVPTTERGCSPFFPCPFYRGWSTLTLGACLRVSRSCFQERPIPFAGALALEWQNGSRTEIQGRFLSNGTVPAGSTWARNPLPYSNSKVPPEFEPPCNEDPEAWRTESGAKQRSTRARPTDVGSALACTPALTDRRECPARRLCRAAGCCRPLLGAFPRQRLARRLAHSPAGHATRRVGSPGKRPPVATTPVLRCMRVLASQPVAEERHVQFRYDCEETAQVRACGWCLRPARPPRRTCALTAEAPVAGGGGS